jgi:hypothetical protein
MNPLFLSRIQVHGAGFMNAIFLRPGCALFEVVPIETWDSRHAPVVGIFPRVAIAFGLHSHIMLANVSSPLFPELLVEELSHFLSLAAF